MTDFGELYRESRERIGAIVRAADAGQLATVVPGCPAWTVADTVAHLTAIVTDAISGKLTGVPSDEETAAQVEQRRGMAPEDILAEWAESAPAIEHGLHEQRIPLPIVHDVLTHEADLSGALGTDRPPAAAWQASLHAMTRRPERLEGPGTLVIRLDGGVWPELRAGSGEPVTTLDVHAYEFWRSLFGRRSTRQMAGWQWSGDPAPYLKAIPVFGPTDKDLTEPA